MERAEYIWGRSKQSGVAGAENYSCDAVGNPSFRTVGFILMPWESTDDSGSGGVPPGGDAQDRGGEADCLSRSCCVIQA